MIIYFVLKLKCTNEKIQLRRVGETLIYSRHVSVQCTTNNFCSLSLHFKIHLRFIQWSLFVSVLFASIYSCIFKTLNFSLSIFSVFKSFSLHFLWWLYCVALLAVTFIIANYAEKLTKQNEEKKTTSSEHSRLYVRFVRRNIVCIVYDLMLNCWVCIWCTSIHFMISFFFIFFAFAIHFQHK